MPTRLLEALRPEVRSQLEARMIRRRYAAGDVIFSEGQIGDSLMIIESGRVELQRTTADGHLLTLHVAQPGDVVGEMALVLESHTRSSRARALEDVLVRTLSRPDFELLRRRHPDVDRFLVEILAARVQRTNDLALELTMDPETRVWRRIAVLASAYGSEPIRMSQETLAHVAGTVRQTVNRVLRDGQRDGIIELRRGEITVVDSDAVNRRGHP